MPMGEGTYGSKVGRPKEEKREGMMGGMMPGKHRKKAYGGGMQRTTKGTGGMTMRKGYAGGGEVLKPN